MNDCKLKKRLSNLAKVCFTCKLEKPLSSFWKDKNSKQGCRGSCSSCMIEQHRKWKATTNYLTDYKLKLKTKYGLSYEDYLVILEKQNNKCAICGVTPTRRLDVDHNHETGKVRGLLCPKCNRALGSFNDNIVYLSRAIEYLNVEDTPSVG